MKKFTKMFLIIFLLFIGFQQANAQAKPPVKWYDFSTWSTRAKTYYVLGAIAPGAALALGWYEVRINKVFQLEFPIDEIKANLPKDFVILRIMILDDETGVLEELEY